MRRLLCALGFHGRNLRTVWGQTPDRSRRRCVACGRAWKGTYDGVWTGWRQL